MLPNEHKTLDARIYYVKKIQEGDDQHFEALYNSYRGMIETIVGKHKFYDHVDPEDLRQEGRIALYKAAKGFDLEKGDYKEKVFSVYAFNAIENNILGYIRKITSYNQYSEETRVEFINVDFNILAKNTADPNDEYTHADGYDTIHTFVIGADSLEDAGIEFINLTDTDIDQPDTREGYLQAIEDLKMQKDIETLINALTNREKYVIINLYGIGCEKKTNENIAQDLGISHGMVSDIKFKALSKMRQAAILNNIQY